MRPASQMHCDELVCGRQAGGCQGALFLTHWQCYSLQHCAGHRADLVLGWSENPGAGSAGTREFFQPLALDSPCLTFSTAFDLGGLG